MGYDNLKVAVQQDRALLKAVGKCNIVEYEEEVDKQYESFNKEWNGDRSS